jgi:hypothetical protein
VADDATHTLTDLLAALARDAVVTQLRLDAHVGSAQESHAAAVAAAPAEQRALLAELMPPDLRVTSFRMRCRARIEIGSAAGVAIGARPLNLGYDLLHRTSRDTDATVSVEVVQAPLDPGAIAPRS